MKNENKKHKTASDNTGDKSSITPREIEIFFSDETMVVIKNAYKIQIWGKSDKNHVPHLICCEDKKQVAVMFWGCVSTRGEEALIPVLGTIYTIQC